MATRVRDQYYVEGNTVRKRQTAVPSPRRQEPVRAPKRGSKTYVKAARKAENSLGFDRAYTAVLTVMLLVMIVACVVMLTVQGNVESKKNNIQSLQNELSSIQADNAAFENSLNDMYSLEDIYSIATSELGMVYSQNGQIRYYDSEKGDYVKQYSDVPKTE